MSKTVKDSFKDFAKNTLHFAAVFGLITGLVEGLLLFGLRQLELLTWRLQNRAYWYETLWIAPFVDVTLFLLAGLALTLVGFPLRKKIPVNKLGLFLFAFLAIFDWMFIILFGRISLLPILILAIGMSVQVFNVLSKREKTIYPYLSIQLKRLAGAVIAIFVIIQGGGWVTETIKTSQLSDNPTSPNVIVIVVDTLRADHLGSYGYERDTSPFMDSLAAEGVRFENAISPSSWTQPSHASMLTGRYTYEHQAETQPLDGTYPTIGEAMQVYGYRTGAFSANTLFFTRRQGFGRGFLHFEDNYLSMSDAFLNSSLYGYLFDYYGLRKALNYEGVPYRRNAPDINQSVLSWVDRSDQPFFVFINYFDVHDPYTPPEPYRSRFTSAQNPGGLINGFMERYSPVLTPEQIQTEIDAYDGAIAYVDDQIKALFSELKARGELDRTIVIITSDHGESLGEHGLLQHSASLYLPEIHVPLIVWGPGIIPAGQVVDMPVSTVGLPVTILTLLDANVGTFPGQSLSLLFDGSAPQAWDQPIAELAHLPGAAKINPSTHGAMKSVIGEEYQYITHENFGEELYNWRSDPQEAIDLIDDPAVRTVADAFREYLARLIGDFFKKP